MEPLSRKDGEFRFGWTELSGSLGDLGLFLPLTVAMSLTTGLDFGVILICAGLMNVVTGLMFRQPIPVQPMKAIAVVAITEALTPGALTAAGLLMGIFMISLALSGLVDGAARRVPRAVVRGIQFGVGLKLARMALQGMGDLPWLGWGGLLVAIGAVSVLGILRARRVPVLLPVFLGGFLIQYVTRPEAFDAVTLAWPAFGLHWPDGARWLEGLTRGAIPQLPLTLLNSVVAVCALSEDYFPGRGISPRRTAVSVGLMNLVCVPLGGVPMCHGSGGLAAQHRFGARTGASVIMLGGMKILAGLLFGGALVGLLGTYPVAILGPMLPLAGVELARAARDMRNMPDLTVVAVTAGVIIFWNTLAGFLAGLAVVAIIGFGRSFRHEAAPHRGGEEAGQDSPDGTTRPRAEGTRDAGGDHQALLPRP